MPPASRGFFRPRSSILLFLRSRPFSTLSYRASRQTEKVEYLDARKIRPPRLKSSPIRGRARKEPIKVSPEALGREGEQIQARTLGLPPHTWRFIGNILIAVPIIAFVVTHIPLSVMTVTGGSMRPLFNPNSAMGDEVEARDKMLVVLSGHWRQGDVERGEIVVFKTPHDPEKIAVKRVVAVAGDKVLPLPGYQGSEDEQSGGVVVQYNHMWVEGDVNDRSKSVDSNWYGPISQNLVVGRASALLSPWYRPRWIRVSEQGWPADEKRRVKYNAVQQATKDPDQITSRDYFTDGMAQTSLENMRMDRHRLTQHAVDEKSRRQLVGVYQQAREELQKQDPETTEVASAIVKEIELAFYRAGGSIEHPVFPEIRQMVQQETAEEMAKRQTRREEHARDEVGPEQRMRNASRRLYELEKQNMELVEATERAKQKLREQAGQA